METVKAMQSQPTNNDAVLGGQVQPSADSAVLGGERLHPRYHKLQDCLANGRWREADAETLNLILDIAGRKDQRSLRPVDIEQFPREEFCTIDRLWVEFSNGRFGFSVQKQLYLECGNRPGRYDEGLHCKFCDSVGWCFNDIPMVEWFDYSELTFDLCAPIRHLPAATSFAGGWYKTAVVGVYLA